MPRETGILVAAGAAMAVVLVYVGRWLLFWGDEWNFVFDRADPTIEALLSPYLDTLVAVPVLVYDALLAVFGLQTYLPYLIVAWIAHFVAVALLYRIVKRRSGSLLGVAAAISVLFLGSGFEVLLQPFQIQYLFAVVGGLLAIDQLDRDRPAVASAALVVAVASSGLGVIFTGLILAWGVLRRHRPTIAAVIAPIALYAIWYVTWGQESIRLAGPGFTLPDAIGAVAYGMGAAVSGLVGLPPSRFAVVGLALGIATIAAIVAAAWRGYRPDVLALAALAALTAEHVLQVALRGSFGAEHGARSGYVYPGVIFLWLALAGALGARLDGLRTRRPILVPLVVAVLVVVAVAGNMRQFAGAAVASRTLRATALAELRLIESLRDDPGLAVHVTPDELHTSGVTAARYFAAIDRFGRPDLPWEWEAEVDSAAVEAARRRLLPSP